MTVTADHLRRQAQVAKWFGPARFGLFYHWGLYTGGGCTHPDPKWRWPLRYSSVADFERAAPDPKLVARNMVGAAVACGAKYITLTALHTCGGYCVLYPTRLSGFKMKTSLDYLGEFIRACVAAEVKPVLYVPAPPNHWNTMGGPWLEEGCRDNPGYAKLLTALVEELAALHGHAIGGFWIDGMIPELEQLPKRIHELLPEAVVVHNNDTMLTIPDVDVGATEFLSDTPCPAYCRPSALRKVGPYNVPPPGMDFNEDIPTCNQWWYMDGPEHCSPESWNGVLRDKAPYVADPNFLIKQLLSSIGQRGQWNFALGIGPRIDGTVPPEFAPSLRRVGDFMAWGAEAVYRTTGGERSCIQPGWFNDGGFCSVTVSHDRPNIHYVAVATAPKKGDRAFLHVNGHAAVQVTDMRTGTAMRFHTAGTLVIEDVEWSDVDTWGARLLKVEFA